jgi:hypothetical protein
MRRSMLVFAAFLGSTFAVSIPPTTATAACASVADESAYEILALRQMMTELALKCGKQAEADYNNYFVKRFQPVLQSNDREVLTYFRRLYGGAGQSRMTTFTTELISEISRLANHQGGEFCPRANLMFNEMNALTAMDQVAAYAAVKDLTPRDMSMCPAAAPRRR